MKYIPLLLFLILFTNCSTNKSITGLYGKCRKHYWACSQIELNPDNTFEYFIFMDVGGGNIVKGTWRHVSKDTIILNTYNQPKVLKTTYKGSIHPNVKRKVKIQISDYNGPIGFTNFFINNRALAKAADINGIVEFEVDSIKNIEYDFIGQHEIIKIDNPNYNEIDILIRDLDISAVPEFLTDYKVVFKKRKLIMDSIYSYKKTHINNKQWD